MTADPETLRRRNQELAILNEVAGALNRSADLESVLEGVLARVAELLGLEAGWIWLLAEDDSGTSYLAASRNLPPGLGTSSSTRKLRVCASAVVAMKLTRPWTVAPLTNVATPGSPTRIRCTSRSET